MRGVVAKVVEVRSRDIGKGETRYNLPREERVREVLHGLRERYRHGTTEDLGYFLQVIVPVRREKEAGGEDEVAETSR
jgi:hypothetical protein